MDKKVILVAVGCLIGGWIAHEVYDKWSATGVVEFDPEKFNKIKSGISEASHAMNAVSNLSREVRLK